MAARTSSAVGTYTWFVWPAYSKTRYGRMLGKSSFRIVSR